jgi:hypothetical protein
MQKDASKAELGAYWAQDTLRVTSTGLSSATFSFSDRSNAGSFVSINGSASTSIAADKPDGRTILSLAQHQLFPRIRHQTIFKLKIPK